MLSPSIMGVVNVTPDSFYGATRTPDATDAINRGIALFNEGADIVDVGGESTRPGAVDVDVVEELARISPVVEALAAYGPVSIDTRKAQVARAAVALGASVINDVGGSLAEVAGELKVGYVAMHAQGTPQTMQINPHYDDVLAEVLDGLATLAQRAQGAGVAQLWLDPGIGFGKRLEDNWTLLRHTSDVVGLASSLGAGVLIGTSRKRFLASTGVEPLEVDDRFEASLATATWALAQGASMVRVHDVVALAQVRELLVRPVAEVGS